MCLTKCLFLFLSWRGYIQQALSWLVLEIQQLEASLPVCCVSEAGVLVRSYVERSMMVPDHVMTRLMLPRLEQLIGQSWLLDGMK